MVVDEDSSSGHRPVYCGVVAAVLGRSWQQVPSSAVGEAARELAAGTERFARIGRTEEALGDRRPIHPEVV